jgi:hypothetical protein
MKAFIRGAEIPVRRPGKASPALNAPHILTVALGALNGKNGSAFALRVTPFACRQDGNLESVTAALALIFGHLGHEISKPDDLGLLSMYCAQPPSSPIEESPSRERFRREPKT